MPQRNKHPMRQGAFYALSLALLAGSAIGGSLDSPAAPDQAASAMYTLDDIYNKLDTRTPAAKRTGAFVEPAAGPTAGASKTLNDVMDMANTRQPVARTGQTTSYGVGSDGNLRIGGVWPSPRFKLAAEDGIGTNCVIDNLTGLMWTRNANLANSKMSWSDALVYCASLNDGVGTYGYKDWRLPNLNELRSLVALQWGNPALCNATGTAKHTNGNPFFDLKSAGSEYYWSSSSYMISPTDKAWPVSFYSGDSYPHNFGLKTVLYYVWPVRGPDL